MLLHKERNSIIEYGKKLVENRLTKGTGGNLSVFDPASGLMVISPSGIDYTEIKPEQVAVLKVETGEQVEGAAKASSEVEMHRILYANRPDLRAVIHTHSTYAATLSCLNISLPAVHYLVAFAGPDVQCSSYATFGTKKLAENALEAMKDRKACLLANHGLLAGGRDLMEAFTVTEEIEFCCELYYRAKSIGEPVILPEDEMERMVERFQHYGRK